MWRDYFYYTRNDRRGLTVLLVIIVVIGVMSAVLRHSHGYEQAEQTDSLLTEYEKFRATLQSRDSLDRLSYTLPRKYHKTEKRHTALQILPSPFNPNADDSATLVQSGLPPYVARNIIRYREKGGKFHRKEDLSKIYGMDQETYNRIADYIIIIQEKPRHEDNHPATAKVKAAKFAEGTVIDINTADTATLMKIPGIGKGYSAMIVRYRNRLGGFVSTQQLKEIEGLPQELIRWFTVSKDYTPRRININHAGLEKMRSHPYMNFYRAKAIIEYRRKYGKFKSINQLEFLDGFDHGTVEKLKPYIGL